jgi:hypothetical protein
VAVVNPAFDVIAKRVDQLIALNRRGLQLAGVARPYIAGDGVVRAPRQLGCVSKTMRQIVGRQDLHNRLGLLHSRLLGSCADAQWTEGEPLAGSTWSCRPTPTWADFVTAAGQLRGRQRAAF